MKVYQVGGAVRDKLLGRAPKDFDFLITGVTPETLLSQGYIPVGKSYEVFLHPETKEEYTLSSDLYSDLSRRDLTINAMALEGEKLHDPFGGLEDLKAKILRSVKDENFLNDPVRVYRLARFYTELDGFTVSHETIDLIITVAQNPGLKLIHPERILKELVKVFKCSNPSRFFIFLKNYKLLSCHFHELETLSEDQFSHTMKLLDTVSEALDPVLSYACLFIHSQPKSAENISKRLLVSNQWRMGALAVEKFYNFFLAEDLSAQDIVDVFYKLDAFRNPESLGVIEKILFADGCKERSDFISRCYDVTNQISAADISQDVSGRDLGNAIKELRIRQLR